MALRDWCLRPAAVDQVRRIIGTGDAAAEAIEDAIYAPYLKRLKGEVERRKRDGDVSIPASLDLNSVPGLATEMLERLSTARPETLDQASRIPGITPAALAALHFAIVKRAA